MYASEKKKADSRYPTNVQKVFVLKTRDRSLEIGEAEVGRPTFRVLIWRRNMNRLAMKKTRVLSPAGPSGNHHQSRSVSVNYM
jgi:hypothetical protein